MAPSPALQARLKELERERKSSLRGRGPSWSVEDEILGQLGRRLDAEERGDGLARVRRALRAGGAAEAGEAVEAGLVEALAPLATGAAVAAAGGGGLAAAGLLSHLGLLTAAAPAAAIRAGLASARALPPPAAMKVPAPPPPPLQ